MARTKGTVEGIVGKVSLGRQVEFFVQLFGWDEERIVAALLATDPTISDPEKINNIRNLIRVTKSKFKSEKQENDMIDTIVGRGEMIGFDNIKAQPVDRISCGIRQIDELFGYSDDSKHWGFPRGQVSLIAGSPGVGKTRLMVAVCGSMTEPETKQKCTAAYFQNEFALSQFKVMSNRVIKEGSRFMCGDLHRLKDQLNWIADQKPCPDLIVVDSIQMLSEAKNRSGIERCIAAYKCAAMDRGFHICFIGQLNKQGEVAGSRSVEHLVDQVFTAKTAFLPNQFSLYVTKNRWGRSGISARFEHHGFGVRCVSEGLGPAEK
jgi:predicted ATP-dependent serine protease